LQRPASSPLHVALPATAGGPSYLPIVREGFGQLVGLRWLSHPRQPVPFEKNFAAAWCGNGLTPKQAYEGFRYLREQGAVVQVDQIGRLHLYLPGELR
jgi:hypothetical protein